jgi:hypothetical protein
LIKKLRKLSCMLQSGSEEEEEEEEEERCAYKSNV